MTNATAKIFIVDDHPLVREWLTQLIKRQPDLTVSGEAEDAASALKAIAKDRPNLVIIDLSLGSGSGIDLIESIRESYCNVDMLVLSMHDEEVYAERSIRAGARGYIMKRETATNVIEAIREVLKGNVYLSKRMTSLMVEKAVFANTPKGAPPVSQLSERELQVFQMLGQNQSLDDIAKKLSLSIKTVHTYCARIKEKIKVDTTSELVREAERWQGVLPAP